MPMKPVYARCAVATSLLALTATLGGATSAFGAAAQPAAAPAGWITASAEGAWYYELNVPLTWDMLDANGVPVRFDVAVEDEVVPPSIFLEVSYSTSQVQRVGDRVDYQIVVRRAPAPFNPLPVTYPGASYQAYPTQAVILVNLNGLLDDVAPLSSADFTTDSSARVRVQNNQVTIAADLSAQDFSVISFSAEFTGEGDNILSTSQYAEHVFQYYGATTAPVETRVTVAAPTFEVFKTADVAKVSETGDEITYDVTIERAGVGDGSFTFTDDMTELLADALPFDSADITLDPALAVDPLVTDSGFSFTSDWPTDPVTSRPLDSISLSYTVAFDGETDATSFRNNACIDDGATPVCAEVSVAVADQAEGTPPPATTEAAELAATGHPAELGPVALIGALLAGGGVMLARKRTRLRRSAQ